MTPGWRDRAACIGTDPNLFAESAGSETTLQRHDRYQQAKAVCAACPVAMLCYGDGVKNKESGVWGGVLLTHGRIDRYGMRRPARATKPKPQQSASLRPHGTRAAYRRHHRAGESACPECLTWRRKYEALREARAS